jgi:hypothetical protein
MELPMTTSRSGLPPADWVPVDACALPTAAQPLRVAEFDDLFAATLRAVERPPLATTRARLLLAGDRGLRDRVQRLADAETACCSFFTFTLTPLIDDGQRTLALDVEVPPAHADVLTALVDRAERARGAGA